jgi:glycosyltransferase involved in cell wall biosynthesis
MPKVLLVANTDWYLYNFRFSLAQFLRSQGYEVVLVSPPGQYTPVFEDNHFRWIGWGVSRQAVLPWQELHSFQNLAQIYRQERPDIVHHHTIKPVLYGSIAARRLGMENVVNSITGRGYVFLGNDPKARLLRPVAKALYRRALNHANYAVIFENDADRQYFIREKFVPLDRTWLIYGVGVDPQRFTPAPEPEGVPVVLLSGRMLWDKGVGVLVEAARLLKQRTTVRVVLVGEPDPGNPTSIDKDALHKWGQEGTVEYWGWQPEMNAVYARCHIVTAPTMYGEGVPTVLLEAAACGRPVVTTDMPGCREIVEDGVTGLIVPPGDPLALADALEQLISDPIRRGRMGSAARQQAIQKFTVQQVNTATLAIYSKVLGKAVTSEEEI